MKTSRENETAVWTPTQTQHLYRHRNGRYYVRTYAGGKEKWTGLRTSLLSIARNRMREHIEAAQRQQVLATPREVTQCTLFRDALAVYRRALEVSAVQPNTKRYRQSGLKKLLHSWGGIEAINVRKITPQMVQDWLSKLKSAAKPFVPPRAKTAARNSSGASSTTLNCALDVLKQVLDVAVDSGYLATNPARHGSVKELSRRMLKATRREKAERGGTRIPSKEDLWKVAAAIESAGVRNCRAAVEFVRFLAYSGARPNEGIHVLWSDIDFEKRRIHLRKTKNGENRYVPMTEEMELLLLEMKAESGGKQEIPVLRIREAQGFINTACKKTGVARFTPHALRHFFGTTCLEAGVDVRVVASWLGHKDNGVLLLKTYSHVRRQHEGEMVKRIHFAA